MLHAQCANTRQDADRLSNKQVRCPAIISHMTTHAPSNHRIQRSARCTLVYTHSFFLAPADAGRSAEQMMVTLQPSATDSCTPTAAPALSPKG